MKNNVIVKSLLALLCLPGAAQSRHALVIGNDNYPGNQLKNARNDAKAVQSALSAAGYSSSLVLDADRASLSSKIDTFVETLKPGDTALLYYAGHGFQLDGENYLVPVNFSVGTPEAAREQAYSLSAILERFTSHGAVTQVVILDACRDNPFLASRSLKGGWAGLGTSAGAFLAFGTSPGSTASDDPADGHGLFTKDLLKYLVSSNQDIEEMFRKVREDVIRDSGGHQVPWIASSLIGTFHVRPELDEKQREITVYSPPSNNNDESPANYRNFVSGQSSLASSIMTSATKEQTAALNRAVVLVRGAKINEAISILEAILSINPAFSIASHLLGLILHMAGRDIEAVDVLTRTMLLNPADGAAAAYRCAIEAASDKPSAASDCDSAARTAPTNETYLAYAAELHATAQDEKAAQSVSRSIDLEPTELAYSLRGLIEWRAGDTTAAKSDFSKASMLKPSTSSFR